jgi:hypothetical protein
VRVTWHRHGGRPCYLSGNLLDERPIPVVGHQIRGTVAPRDAVRLIPLRGAERSETEDVLRVGRRVQHAPTAVEPDGTSSRKCMASVIVIGAAWNAMIGVIHPWHPLWGGPGFSALRRPRVLVLILQTVFPLPRRRPVHMRWITSGGLVKQISAPSTLNYP